MTKLREMVKARTMWTQTEARNQALAMESQIALLKKRKLIDDDRELRISRATPPSYIELRSRRITVDHDQNSALVEEKLCPNPSSDHGHSASVSCCSSNGSGEEINERAEFVDLKVNEAETSTYYSCREEESSETSTRELSVLDSTIKKTMAEDQNSGRRKSAVVVEKMNMPLKLEIEEFFAEAEKKIQKEFVEKYNFDIVKDQPLQGRYQWVRMRP